MLNKEKDLILVLGHTGRVGRELCKLISAKSYKYYGRAHPDEWSLNNIYTNFQESNTPVTHIVNLAAVTTTIKLNNIIPYDIASQTLKINLNLFNSLLRKSYLGKELDRPKKIINVVSSCSYGEAELLKEENYLKGNIHESVRPHGHAKQMAYLLGKWAKDQYGINVTTLCFNNIYGNANWTKPDGLKVLEALVKKFVDARQAGYNTVEIWGSGQARREFLHAQDAAQSILLCLEKDLDCDLLNIGCGQDFSIYALAQMIATATGFTGRIKYDYTKPDGQLVKLLDNSLMKFHLNWEPEIDIVEGISRSVQEYKNALSNNR